MKMQVNILHATKLAIIDAPDFRAKIELYEHFYHISFTLFGEFTTTSIPATVSLTDAIAYTMKFYTGDK